jgi:hypothetical protein
LYSNTCDIDDDLESYSIGALPEEAAARVEQHLLICEACRMPLVGAEDYIAAMKYAARDLLSECAGGQSSNVPLDLGSSETYRMGLATPSAAGTDQTDPETRSPDLGFASLQLDPALP